MQALGLIETRGFLAAVECADVMLKAAQVELVGRTFVGGGLVMIAVTGDVGAVQASVEAGAAAAKQIRNTSLVSQHVIPRPDSHIEHLLISNIPPSSDLKTPMKESLPKQEISKQLFESNETAKESSDSSQPQLTFSSKEEVDTFVHQFGLKNGLDALKALSVAKLRKLAKGYKDLDVADRVIAKANKDLLLQKFKGYYERKK
ncbi:major carboxysome shell protein 1A [Desulfosporosinus acididurans]|uniref:Major carboxysome shell protein 1A n=1 Tax=Desulfosporosinus acididurans TaxID=476652 RepID=A0A0J1IPE6_9FIRM|nr:BMC domain-containing protein [Desulfosporosinus acididurans]KLU66556.1 major carboxysome shell protein 1A [Desulfosporosinus acididurans]